MKHTPAPWTNTNSHYIDSASGHRIAEVYNHAPGYMNNANLIAAAPELLEALKALFENCAMIHKHWGDNSNQKQSDDAIAFALAAIQKAEGNTSK